MNKTDKTEQEALRSLTTLCSKAEHCSGEMLEKMRRWHLDEEAQARFMAYLTEHHYIDDARFCEAFVRDKVRFAGWGRRKIEQALWQKRVDESVSAPILDAVTDEEWLEVLRPLVKQKWRTISGRSDYERSMKLIKFCMQRGFTMDIIRQCVDATDELPDEE